MTERHVLFVLGTLLALTGLVVASSIDNWGWGLPFAVAANVCVLVAIAKEKSSS